LSQKTDFVLDASALLAYLRNEPGKEEVRNALQERAVIGAVNWAEVLCKLVDLGYDLEMARQRLRDEGVIGAALIIWPFDENLARAVAELRNQTRSSGLSLGDRACIALASLLKVPVLTADRSWTRLKTKVAIRAIR
jgi:PIN domain nuclease of toxin-antitoxin system